MKNSILYILFLMFFCNFSFANKEKWKDQNLIDLDKEQFRRLESGNDDPLFISQIILDKSRNKPNRFLINAYTVFGIVNKNKGFYVTALDNYLKAAHFAEKINDQGRFSAALNNIGIIYILQENYSKAIVYFNKSLEIEEKRNDVLQKSIRYFNLGECYKELKRFDEAIGYYTNSLLIEKKEKNKVGIVYAQLGLAEVYLLSNRSNDAEHVLNQFSDNKSFFDPESEVLLHRLKGNYFLKKGDFTLAEDHYLQANNLSKKHQFVNEQLKIFEKLSELHEKTNNFQQALFYSKAFQKLNNTLKSNYIKNQLEEMIYQQEIQKKELEIKLLKKQKELAKKNESAVRKLRLFDIKIAVFSVFSMITFVVIVVVGIRKMTKLNKNENR